MLSGQLCLVTSIRLLASPSVTIPLSPPSRSCIVPCSAAKEKVKAKTTAKKSTTKVCHSVGACFCIVVQSPTHMRQYIARCFGSVPLQPRIPPPRPTYCQPLYELGRRPGFLPNSPPPPSHTPTFYCLTPPFAYVWFQMRRGRAPRRPTRPANRLARLAARAWARLVASDELEVAKGLAG